MLLSRSTQNVGKRTRAADLHPRCSYSPEAGVTAPKHVLNEPKQVLNEPKRVFNEPEHIDAPLSEYPKCRETHESRGSTSAVFVCT